jgi:oligopeptide transport system permease protein
LLWAVPTLLGVVVLAFLLMRLLPGGPFSRERALPAFAQAELERRYHLDGSVWEQIGGYLGGVVRGDLGVSLKYRDRSVSEIIAQTLPVSALLGATAFALAFSFGIAMGVGAASRQDGALDWSLMLLALLGISLPSFVIGPFFILIFGFWLGWAPVGGWGTISHLWLPACALAIPYIAYIARMVRVSMLETLGLDFIRTARAKGAAEASILYRHALKVAALPVVSYAGPLAAGLLTGSMVVEEIFGVPGMGPFFVNSINNRDYFLLAGLLVVYGALLVVFNLVVDVLYSVLDPRIR